MNFHQGKCCFAETINQLFLDMTGHTQALTAVGLCQFHCVAVNTLPVSQHPLGSYCALACAGVCVCVCV